MKSALRGVQSAAPATKSALSGAQSAAPATKSPLSAQPARPKSEYSPHENANHNVGIQRYDPFSATVSQKSANHNVGLGSKKRITIIFFKRVQRYDFDFCPTPAT